MAFQLQPLFTLLYVRACLHMYWNRHLQGSETKMGNPFLQRNKTIPHCTCYQIQVEVKAASSIEWALTLIRMCTHYDPITKPDWSNKALNCHVFWTAQEGV